MVSTQRAGFTHIEYWPTTVKETCPICNGTGKAQPNVGFLFCEMCHGMGSRRRVHYERKEYRS